MEKGCNCMRNGKMNRYIKGAILFLLFAAPLFAESEGERLFKSNDPTAAIPILERELSSGSASVVAYNYLGLSYYQTGQYDKSVAVFERGLAVPCTDKKVLAYNAGNSAFAAGNYAKADSCYSLALSASPDFAKALLNRANARLNQMQLEGALGDYERYIEKVPGDPQRTEIERVIALIRAELVKREEDARAAAALERMRREEEARMYAEQERVAADKARREAEARAAEEARKKKLLEDVANSLRSTNAENMTGGAEDTLGYETEPELD